MVIGQLPEVIEVELKVPGWYFGVFSDRKV